MKKNVLLFFTILIAGAIVLFSLVPSKFSWLFSCGTDVELHFGAYLFLSFLLATVCMKRFSVDPLKAAVYAMIVSILLGGMLEGIQWFLPSRVFALHDLLANLGGSVAGSLISFFANRRT